MATLPTYFTEFTSSIALKKSTRDALIAEHTKLRERLAQSEDLKDIYVATFLQGSYRRSTGIRPTKKDRADVDVVLVTNLDSATHTPAQAFANFKDFLNKHYKGEWVQQGRSIGITRPQVDLDLVITAKPDAEDTRLLKSESVQSDRDLDEPESWLPSQLWAADAEEDQLKEAANNEWKAKPLLIPDRDSKTWEQTHPLEQIRWTHAKNKVTNGHFLRVVRAIKAWHRTKNADLERPKSYPLEHIIGDCCPNGIKSIAEGVTRTLETIAVRYESAIAAGKTPVAPDRGVPEHDVLKRITPAQFKSFVDRVKKAAKEARVALDEEDTKRSCKHWRAFFGDEFPECGGDSDDKTNSDRKGFKVPDRPAQPGPTRFASTS